MEYIRETLREDVLATNKSASIKSVYTAMHGVGYKFILKAFETANLPVLSIFKLF